MTATIVLVCWYIMKVEIGIEGVYPVIFFQRQDAIQNIHNACRLK